MDPELLLALAQGVLGGVQTITGGAKAKRLLAQRKAYVTPEEYNKQLQLTESMAGGGYDPFTLNYLTNQTDRAYNKSVGVAERLGANPNDLAGLFDSKVNDIMKIGAENHALNMNNVGKYLTALDTIGQNKAAEWKSQQDLIKDQQQAASAQQQAGLQNIIGGVDTGIAIDSANKLKKLYTVPQTVTTATGSTSNSPYTIKPNYSSLTDIYPGQTQPDDSLTNAIQTLQKQGVDLSGIDWSAIRKF